jgi:hypothetical protein
MGAFTKVSWFNLPKVVTWGTSARYEQALPVLVPVKASDPCLCGLFDLGNFATCKSLLSSLNFA